MKESNKVSTPKFFESPVMRTFLKYVSRHDTFPSLLINKGIERERETLILYLEMQHARDKKLRKKKKKRIESCVL